MLLSIRDMQIPLRAAYAGYFIILSVFPALLLILSSLRYTGLTVETLLELLKNILPDALEDGAEQLVYSAYRNASGTLTAVSAVAALWSSSGGIYGLLIGLNAVYGVSEDRGYVYTRGISIVYAVVFYAVVLLTLALHVFGDLLVSYLLRLSSPVVAFLLSIIDIRFVFLLVVQTALFTLMYMVLPNRRNGFWQSFPGAALACAGWMAFSDAFSAYIAHFSGYSNIYGSIYAVAITMLWLYFCLSILLVGGAFNKFLMQRENVSNL